MQHENPSRLITIAEAAAIHQVPRAWLKEEAEADRLPHLRAGSKILFDAELLEAFLLERARKAGKGASHGH